MLSWHVATLSPGAELTAMKGLGDIDCPAIWPRWTERIASRGRVRELTRSLAPGYVFVRFDAANPLIWHDIRAACGAGFRTFIGGEYPVPVGEGVMEKFLEGCTSADGLMEAPVEARLTGRVYKPGERVRLIGLMGATEGVVVWSDARGVRVTVKLFARDLEMWVPRGIGVLEDGTDRKNKRKRRRRGAAKRRGGSGI